MLVFDLPQYHRVSFLTAGGDQEYFDIELQDVFEDAGRTYDRLIPQRFVPLRAASVACFCFYGIIKEHKQI